MYTIRTYDASRWNYSMWKRFGKYQLSIPRDGSTFFLFFFWAKRVIIYSWFANLSHSMNMFVSRLRTITSTTWFSESNESLATDERRRTFGELSPKKYWTGAIASRRKNREIRITINWENQMCIRRERLQFVEGRGGEGEHTFD